jgi:hypothetical protein
VLKISHHFPMKVLSRLEGFVMPCLHIAIFLLLSHLQLSCILEIVTYSNWMNMKLFKIYLLKYMLVCRKELNRYGPSLPF